VTITGRLPTLFNTVIQAKWGKEIKPGVYRVFFYGTKPNFLNVLFSGLRIDSKLTVVCICAHLRHSAAGENPWLRYNARSGL